MSTTCLRRSRTISLLVEARLAQMLINCTWLLICSSGEWAKSVTKLRDATLLKSGCIIWHELGSDSGAGLATAMVMDSLCTVIYRTPTLTRIPFHLRNLRTPIVSVPHVWKIVSHYISMFVSCPFFVVKPIIILELLKMLFIFPTGKNSRNGESIENMLFKFIVRGSLIKSKL